MKSYNFLRKEDWLKMTQQVLTKYKTNQLTNPMILLSESLNICIYSHPQKNCFIVSQHFSMVRHKGRLKWRSKPTQLYIRLNILLLTLLATYVNSGIIYIGVCLHACIWVYVYILNTYMSMWVCI